RIHADGRAHRRNLLGSGNASAWPAASWVACPWVPIHVCGDWGFVARVTPGTCPPLCWPFGSGSQQGYERTLMNCTLLTIVGCGLVCSPPHELNELAACLECAAYTPQAQWSDAAVPKLSGGCWPRHRRAAP